MCTPESFSGVWLTEVNSQKVLYVTVVLYGQPSEFSESCIEEIKETISRWKAEFNAKVEFHAGYAVDRSPADTPKIVSEVFRV